MSRISDQLRGVDHVVWLSVGAGALYIVYALSRFRQFLTAGYDLGIFDQAVRHYASFQAPWTPLKGDRYDLLGDHFHPILALLAPLYWVWDDPRTLLVVQGCLVASSIPVIHRIADRHLSTRVAWWVTVGYAIGWPIQRMIDFDVHEIAFAVPLLALALDGLDRRDDRLLMLGALPLLLVREDLGMVLLVLGVLRAFRRPRRWVGAILAGAGVLGFWLATSVILPALAPNGQFAYWSYDALGPDAPSAVLFILRHPLRVLEIFVVPGAKARTLAYLLVPLLLLPLGSPYALMSLPLLAQRFLSSRTHLWTTEYHYSAPIWVILVVAAIDTVARVQRHREHLGRRLGAALVATMLLAPAIGMATANSTYPLFRVVYPGWRLTTHMHDQAALVAGIPAGTCVAVDDRLAPHLTHSNRVTLPTVPGPTPDFVALDLSQREVGFPLPSPQRVLKDVQAKGYTEVARQGQLVLLRRPGYTGPTTGCGPLAP